MDTIPKENRILDKVESGINLSVPSIKEVEAPLGGTSIEYNIRVVSNLQLLRSHNSNKDNAVEYSVFKTYREIEDLVNKLKKKHPQYKTLALPKAHVSVEEKLIACDRVMKLIASNSSLIESSSLLQFLGIDPQTKELTIDTGIIEQNCVEENSPIETEEKQAADGSDEKEDFDLFEELVKKEKAKQNTSETDDSQHKNVPAELFVSSIEQSHEPLTDRSATTSKIKPIQLQGDSLGLFSDIRKPGDVSLFEEQDFGEVITVEDEHLFLVPKKEDDAGELKKPLDSQDDQEDVFRMENDLEELMKWNNPSRKEPTSSEELKDLDSIRNPPAHDEQSSNFGVKVVAPSSLEKPSTPKKPIPPPKPARAKPVPPPKPKVSPPSSKEEALGHDELDIFKYIEQEERASTEEVSLFD